MWILLGLIIGIVAALALPSQFAPPVAYSTYISVAFLAGLDSVIGGIKGGLEDRFDLSVFVSGFILNTLLAALITWMGDKIGVDLYMAAIVTFGVRIFNNFGSIRHDVMHRRNPDSGPAEGPDNEKENSDGAEKQKDIKEDK